MVFDCEIKLSPVPTDHWLVIAKYAPKDAPQIGKGRWTLPTQLLKNRKFLDKIVTRGIKLQDDLEKLQPDETSGNTAIQLLWEEFKKDIKTIAQKTMKDENYKINSQIKALKRDLDNLNRDPAAADSDDIRTNENMIACQLKHLKKKRAGDQKDLISATLANHGENLGGIWSAINKEKKPQDYLQRLKVPNSNPPQYEQDSHRMAELARNYHKNLQLADLGILNHEDFEMSMDILLERIPDSQTIDELEASPLNWTAKESHTSKALQLTKNGSATGMDGCPYKLWKTLETRHEAASKINKTTFDILKMLTTLFNNIQTFGVDEESNFALGWMCPIYKKKDPTEISNYRPITLLNTDYKLLTKVLAIQLMDHIETLIHKDQARFIPRRSIFDQIKLAETIITYAKVANEDGIIIALDQEKAYDKIRHDYLWKMLEAFNLPEPFINTIKSLYRNASIKVAINSIFSKPFRVTRGIRQGDPLSCPIFDIVIEPLACMVRGDDSIKGLSIPGLENPQKINLFADDTSMYLSQKDSLTYVQSSLQDWCEVSGAKFNLEKTEIIPIGSEEYRQQVILTRKINQDEIFPINDKIKIAQDGDAVRLLGAWIGNKIDNVAPWETTVDKIHRNLGFWKRSGPTMKGRKTIIQAVVGGLTQFLTKAQGMPPHIETAITRIIRDFMWEKDSSPRIALEVLQKPINQGGLNLLDIKARNEAIDIMWLREYLTLTPSRPTWAKVLDLIINASGPESTSKKARMNVFLQTWDAPTRGQRATNLNDNTVRMIKVAKKYNTNLAAIRLTPNLRDQLPAWYHLASAPRPITNVASKCLLNTHQVTRVADLNQISARIRMPGQGPNHQPNLTCICRDCVRDRRGGCQHPHACAEEALNRLNLIAPKLNPLQRDGHGNLSLTKRRTMTNEIAKANNGSILFDPSITSKNDLAECFRIFTTPDRLSNIPAERLQGRGAAMRVPEINIYTDGACHDNGKANARCGSGVWVEHGHAWNKAVRIPGNDQSNQIGEIAAVVIAASTVPPSWPMKIHTDSKYVIDGLTENLPRWEDRGWIGIKNDRFFKKAAYLLKKRTATTSFQWVKGHEGNLGNEESDRLAKEGAGKNAPDNLDLDIPREFDLQGAKLITLTQSIAYKGIQERKPPYTRQTTEDNLQRARDAINAYAGTMETSESLWLSLYNPSLRIRVQQFLYKSMHGTQKIGDYWRNIPGYEERQKCQTCGSTESMEHILSVCQNPAVQTIWNLAKNRWPHEDIPWPEINIGTILSCGNICVRPNADYQPLAAEAPKKVSKAGETRLLQILISESAHLIWVLRCERVIQEKRHNVEEMTKRWHNVINKRLTDDRIIATQIKRTKGALQKVKRTWEKTLEKDGDLPELWIQNKEVLVGRRR